MKADFVGESTNIGRKPKQKPMKKKCILMPMARVTEELLSVEKEGERTLSSEMMVVRDGTRIVEAGGVKSHQRRVQGLATEFLCDGA